MELKKLVASKKQEILSKTAIQALESQPKLRGIEDILNDGIKKHVAETNASLLQAQKDYNQGRPKKWVVFAIGLVLGGLAGWGLPTLTLMLDSSKFSRSSLDNVMYNLLGHRHYPDVLTNELVVISYEYNS